MGILDKLNLPIPPLRNDENQFAGVYGPAEWFESGSKADESKFVDVYGPAEWFDGKPEDEPADLADEEDEIAEEPAGTGRETEPESE